MAEKPAILYYQKQPTSVARLATFSHVYDLHEILGRGGFAVVYKCVHKESNKSFAVKIINVGTMREKDHKALDNEARICLMMKHPNIVHLHDVISESKSYFLVFDLIVGGELFEDIVHRAHYSEADASACMLQIIDALSYCHSLRIVHRDLKPENFLLASKDKNAAIKMADFGLAVELPKDQDKGWFGFSGTPGYVSPEVINKRAYGKPVDIWACGVILYILLVGYPPFWEKTRNQLFEKITKGDYAFRSPEWDPISNNAKELIKGMLDVNPDTRSTSDQLRSNPWIAFKNNASMLHRDDTIDRLRKFNALRKLKGVILAIMATRAFKGGVKRTAIGSSSAAINKSAAAGAVAKGGVQPTQLTHTATTGMSAARRSEIIGITEQLLSCIDNGDYEDYLKLIVPHLTTFDPEGAGELIQGLDVHKEKFAEGRMLNVVHTTIVDPYVHLLGENSACIAYTRVTQFRDSGGKLQTVKYDESRVWTRQAPNKRWLNVHLHRSVCPLTAGDGVQRAEKWQPVLSV